jgi:hypothetical protein
MKLEIEISDELWKRIEYSANQFHMNAHEYLRKLLNDRVQRIPDPIAAEKRIAEIRAAAGPEDDYDPDELTRALEEARGRPYPLPPEPRETAR